MDELIPTINKLQDVFNTTNTDCIQLPEIVVVGAQSSGKSSVLENIVGRDFLPRGTGIVTRRPLILQLVHINPPVKENEDLSDENISLPDSDSSVEDAVKDHAKFLHTRDKIFYDFAEVKEEIERETERLSGTNKGITAEAIHLKIFSSEVFNLTLVDLPGLVKVPVGDQPPDIEEQVKDLILRYISNPNSIILALTPANVDFATSEALMLAKKVDPTGRRTLAVVTKLDLMDQGTDAIDVLCGKIIPIKLGIIGVMNRSQMDINTKKSIKAAVRDERHFLLKQYPTIAARNGTKFLSKTLNNLLMYHIRDCLPDLKARISMLASNYLSIINSYGDISGDELGVLLRIITGFAKEYCDTIEGRAHNIETSELCGGARICYIFNEIFGKTLRSVDSVEGLTDVDILTAIRNANGSRPTWFIPELTFELLVKRQIKRLEEPSLCCVSLVFDELQRIVQHCGTKSLERFPVLWSRICEVMNDLLKERLPITNEMVSHLVAIELAYINTKHPDFINSPTTTEIMTSVLQTLQVKEETVGRKEEEINYLNPEKMKENRYTPSEPSLDVVLHEQPETSQNIFAKWRKPNNPQIEEQKKSHSIFSEDCPLEGTSEFYKTPNQNNQRINLINNSMMSSRNLTLHEKRDVNIIRGLIKSYFKIVLKNIQDSVPKTIMHNMVNYVKEHLQSQLVGVLYKPEDIKELLKESDDVCEKRIEAIKMLEALKKASVIISEIRDFKI